MRAGERAELEEMREKIVGRMQELDTQVDQGALTTAQKEDLLREEFGTEYKQALAQIHELLHQPREEIRAVDTKLPAFLGVLIIAAFTITLLFGSSITGLATATQTQTLELDATLADGQSARLAIEERMQISGLIIDAQEADTYTLTLEDANGKHLIHRKTREESECVGCAKTYRPPYLLSIETSSEIYLQSIKYVEESG